MALPSNDINDLNRRNVIESVSIPGQAGKVVLNPDGTNIGDSLPVNSSNPSTVLAYDSVGNLITWTKTIGSIDYQKTFTYDSNGNLTDISEWIEL